MKCLIVDDSRTMRNIEKKVLSAIAGLECLEAGDGIEALNVIGPNPGVFDFMIIDWNMPNMDGLSLIKKIRESDKRTMLIMATTEGEKNRVMEAIKAGVNNYVIKPFTTESLLDKVNQTLSKRIAA